MELWLLGGFFGTMANFVYIPVESPKSMHICSINGLSRIKKEKTWSWEGAVEREP